MFNFDKPKITKYYKNLITDIHEFLKMHWFFFSVSWWRFLGSLLFINRINVVVGNFTKFGYKTSIYRYVSTMWTYMAINISFFSLNAVWIWLKINQLKYMLTAITLQTNKIKPITTNQYGIERKKVLNKNIKHHHLQL